MNRQKGKMPEINRELYKSIKKFDRQQFTSFCTDLYKYGYEDGQNSVPGVDLSRIREAIASTKGIGEKKLEQIMANVEELFNN